ncbi:MAG TPA: hypothetical protein VFK48_06800 [Usitatibacter sp.]|nr:hypothetical protein [Usitatibacter sp.]
MTKKVVGRSEYRVAVAGVMVIGWGGPDVEEPETAPLPQEATTAAVKTAATTRAASAKAIRSTDAPCFFAAPLLVGAFGPEILRNKSLAAP